jgi:4-hydroxymandelate oxidase
VPGPLIVHLADLEALAARRLPRATLEYYAGGAEDERTLRDNVEGWRRLRLRPRALVDVRQVSLATTVLGVPVAAPILVAPLAYQRLAHPAGELATARAAAAEGALMVVSTMATTRLEDVAAAAPAAPRWFQLYVYRERQVSETLVRRAERAGYQALVLTVDTPRLGRRERDVRNGFGLPPELALANFEGELAVEPSHAPGVSGIAHYAAAHLDDSLTWEAVAWLRSITHLPIVVKGVLTGEDTALAVAHGADAVVVSNHGGRQLDGAIATADALAECVAAAGGRAEIYVDGGLRRGSDVLKALALGARAVLVGRPILWGLASEGEFGVRLALAMLRGELEHAMALAGQPRVGDLSRALVR